MKYFKPENHHDINYAEIEINISIYGFVGWNSGRLRCEFQLGELG